MKNMNQNLVWHGSTIFIKVSILLLLVGVCPLIIDIVESWLLFHGFQSFGTVQQYASFISDLSSVLYLCGLPLVGPHPGEPMSDRPSNPTPAKTYLNPETDKKQIMKENKGRCGVYIWTSLENGKRYVGSGINLPERLCDYYSEKNMITALKKSNMLIYKAILKYGLSKFKLEILEYCESSVVLERETYYISLLKTYEEYNILRVAGSQLGRKHSEEAKAKLSAAATGRKHTEETKALIRAFKHTNEAIEKIRAAGIGRKHTEETKAKMSSSKGTKTIVTDLETNEIVEYSSLNAAAKILGTYPISLSRCIQKKRNYLGRYLISTK